MLGVGDFSQLITPKMKQYFAVRNETVKAILAALPDTVSVITSKDGDQVYLDMITKQLNIYCVLKEDEDVGFTISI
jgi:hypothetical protein